jgi:hypothetical protein
LSAESWAPSGGLETSEELGELAEGIRVTE